MFGTFVWNSLPLQMLHWNIHTATIIQAERIRRQGSHWESVFFEEVESVRYTKI
jgi:hypothetical protein